MNLETVFMIDIDLSNSDYKRFYSNRSTVEVLFLSGFIIEFLFRRDIFPIEFRVLALIPFVINLILLAYMVKDIRNLKEKEGHSKRVFNTILKLFMNVVFIVAISYSLDMF